MDEPGGNTDQTLASQPAPAKRACPVATDSTPRSAAVMLGLSVGVGVTSPLPAPRNGLY